MENTPGLTSVFRNYTRQLAFMHISMTISSDKIRKQTTKKTKVHCTEPGKMKVKKREKYLKQNEYMAYSFHNKAGIQEYSNLKMKKITKVYSHIVHTICAHFLK